MKKMCFVNLEKAFEGELRKVLEWAMRKKRIPEVLGRSVTSQCERAKECEGAF